jgi:tetratricopeptide (TPR) repeat protein
MSVVKQVIVQATALNTQGRILAEDGKLDEAIAKLQEAVKLKADYPEVYVNLGDALRKKGSIDEAIKAYTHALALNPTNPEAYFGRGEVYARQDEFQKAINNYTEAIKLNPEVMAGPRARAGVPHARLTHTCGRDYKR